jgi:hypothetical protein
MTIEYDSVAAAILFLSAEKIEFGNLREFGAIAFSAGLVLFIGLARFRDRRLPSFLAPMGIPGIRYQQC